MKVAMITGAGGGIGRAAALALASAGYSVTIAGRREAALAQTIALAPETAAMLAVPTDIRQEDSVAALFRRSTDRFGRLDVLFNNAGVGAPPIPFDELSFAQWQEVMATNLSGAFLCARAAFQIMKAQRPQGGRIINNGSISAQAPRPLSAPYTASKHAITGLTKSLSLDGRPYHIACGQIDIGNAATEMTSRMAHGVLQADGSSQQDLRCKSSM